MTEYAIVDNGSIVGFRHFNTVPNLPGKPYRQFLPVVETNPSFDPETQVKTGPVVTVEAERVTRVWSVRDKTAQELDADVDFLQFRVAFNHENRIRALEGKAAITAAQFRAALKALL